MAPPTRSSKSKILVALDGSPAAATALPVAKTIAGQLGCGVEVAHVVSDPVSADVVREKLHLETETVSLRVVVGHPVEQLLHAANERHVALVVLTTHGRALEEGRQLSHVALEVAAAARHPTLFVRPETAAGHEPGGQFHRFLFPFDGSAATARALKPAIKLVSKLGGSLDLLYVAHSTPRALGEIRTMRPSLYMDEPYYEWPAWISEVLPWLESCCGEVPEAVPMRVHVRSEIEKAGVANAILEFAKRETSDAIILVRRSSMEHGRAPVLRAILHSTPCPVLLVSGRRPRRDDELAGKAVDRPA